MVTTCLHNNLGFIPTVRLLICSFQDWQDKYLGWNWRQRTWSWQCHSRANLGWNVIALSETCCPEGRGYRGSRACRDCHCRCISRALACTLYLDSYCKHGRKCKVYFIKGGGLGILASFGKHKKCHKSSRNKCGHPEIPTKTTICNSSHHNHICAKFNGGQKKQLWTPKGINQKHTLTTAPQGRSSAKGSPWFLSAFVILHFRTSDQERVANSYHGNSLYMCACVCVCLNTFFWVSCYVLLFLMFFPNIIVMIFQLTLFMC